jgi:hypothetical protein
MSQDPKLFYHLAIALNYQPLRIAHPWITFAFVGYLDPSEVKVYSPTELSRSSCCGTES